MVILFILKSLIVLISAIIVIVFNVSLLVTCRKIELSKTNQKCANSNIFNSNETSKEGFLTTYINKLRNLHQSNVERNNHGNKGQKNG